MALSKNWKFEIGNRELAASNTGANLKHQLGQKDL